MAKVKSVKMRLEIDQKRPWVESMVNICYDATDRRTEKYRRPVPSENERFYIMLPKVVADALGGDRVKDKDQKEVMERFKEALEKFKNMKTEVNRVIVYEFEVAPNPDAKMSSWDYGLKVLIKAGTFEETVMIAGDGVKRYSYESIESEVNMGGQFGYRVGSRDSRMEKKQVPWTERNEAFFVWIKVNMLELINRLHELETPESLIETIVAGRLLPLGDLGKGEY